jgi:hypothetical protein
MPTSWPERRFCHFSNGGGLGLERVAFLDQRIDEVGLAAGGELLLYELRDVGLLCGGAQGGDHFPAAGGALVEDGNVEVAVDCHRQGPRDRRGGHHQHVGHRTLLDKAGALRDAELVLLVDDDESEVGEGDLVVEQRVGADEHLRFAIERQVGALLLRRGAQEHPYAERFEPALEGEVMLLGEDLGWRHQRGLRAGVDGQQHRRHRDEGLAAADVALQQPVHRPRRAEVGDDLLDRSLLRAGQVEGQAFVKALQQGGLGPLHPAAVVHDAGATPNDIELEREEFLQSEASARGLGLFDRFREMHLAKCLGARGGRIDIESDRERGKIDLF